DARDEDDLVLAQEGRVPLQRHVEAAEGRAAVARDEGGRVQAAPPVRPVLVERQADQRLDAGQEDDAFLLAVLRVEREGLRARHRGTSGAYDTDPAGGKQSSGAARRRPTGRGRPGAPPAGAGGRAPGTGRWAAPSSP